MDLTFKGAAKRLDDIDLPKLGYLMGVGEDEVHAFLDVETRGHGFDGQGRPIILFEPHVFYRNLPKGAKRDAAVKAGLAYPKWKRDYPPDSYPRLKQACAIDETAALKSASWGLGQVLGENHKDAGYSTVQAMVEAMMADEEYQLLASVNFIKNKKLDRYLRTHAWAFFANGYNGEGYKANHYDTKLADAFAKWSRIKDTPWTPPTGKTVVTTTLRPEPPPAGPQAGTTPDVVLVDGPKKDETTVVVVQTPQNVAQSNPLPGAGTSKTGYAVFGAMLIAIGTAAAKYWGG